MINLEERQILENFKVYSKNPVKGEEVQIGGENFYKISNVD